MSRIVLVGEDDPGDVFFLRRAFEEKCPAARIFDVGDGQEAIDYLAGDGRFADRERYPLPTEAFLDIKMPRRSGLEVLSWMRAQPPFKDIPVTILSGSQLSEDLEEARRLCAEYLVKPVEYSALADLIADHCRRHP